MQEEIIKVGGMSCQGCVQSVERVLRGLDGVIRVAVSLDAAEVQVCFDAGKIGVAQLKSAIEGAGFDAT